VAVLGNQNLVCLQLSGSAASTETRDSRPQSHLAPDLPLACSPMRNALSFDVEDYMHVTAFSERIPAKDWDNCVSRLEQSTDKLLEILASKSCLATFFTLGWVARKFPLVIRRIAEAGHEVACHSMWHRLVYELRPSEFRADTQEAKAVLEDATGVAIRGYRAPSFSIRRDCWWAFDILRELGFTYDSSIFPVKHPNYGLPDGSRFPFSVQTPSGEIIEFPMPTLQAGNRRSPFGGGAYLRLLPYGYTRWAIGYTNRNEKAPVCVYLHPWEIDNEQPRLRANLTARIRHYIGLRGTETKLRRLLNDFDFVPLNTLVEEWRISDAGAQQRSPKLLAAPN
jgi:polysaccharide deacetylase family protein (PEP-CTERM system associated)